MTVIEIVGAVIGIAYLLSEYRASIWTWVFGILMPIAYVYIFFTSALYANTAINIYYIIASVYGFFAWWKVRGTTAKPMVIKSCPSHYFLLIALSVVVLSEAITLLLSLLHESRFPILDGTTTALSIVMMYMLSKRWYQQWILCIITEPLMIALSLLSGLYPTAIMYTIYLIVAILGYIRWKRQFHKQNPTQQ
jgi:nicotinamide mononucleotide transporter